MIGGPAASAKFAPDQALSAAYHHATSHRALIFLPRVVLMGDVAWLSLPTPEFWPALEVGFTALGACFLVTSADCSNTFGAFAVT